MEATRVAEIIRTLQVSVELMSEALNETEKESFEIPLRVTVPVIVPKFH
jgi:hypothetical protein